MKRYKDFIKKTAIDNEYREDCARKDDYFKFWNAQTSKHNNWTCPEYYEIREKKERALQEKQRRRASLCLRRQQLSALLQAEALSQASELARLSAGAAGDVEQLREALAAERSAEEELRLYHQWRRDNPAVREAESAHKRGFVREASSRQEAARLSREAEARAEAGRAEEERRLAVLHRDVAAQDERRRRQDEAARAAALDRETASDKLRENERLCGQLRRQEAAAAQLERDLFALEQQLGRLDQRRAEGRAAVRRAVLERQVVFRLRQRAAETCCELAEDRQLLGDLRAAVEAAAEVGGATDQLATFLRAWDRQVERDKMLAQHTTNLFHEEALRELSVLEARWAGQAAARRALIGSELRERLAHARGKRERAASQRERLQGESEALRKALGTQMEEESCLLQEERERGGEEIEKGAEELEKGGKEHERGGEEEREKEAELSAELQKVSVGGRRRVAWL